VVVKKEGKNLDRKNPFEILNSSDQRCSDERASAV